MAFGGCGSVHGAYVDVIRFILVVKIGCYRGKLMDRSLILTLMLCL